jgi:hypothetical protein
MLENYRVAAQLVASRVVLSSTELVSALILGLTGFFHKIINYEHEERRLLGCNAVWLL